MSDKFEDDKSKANEIVMQALQTKDSRAKAFENAFEKKSPEELTLQQSIDVLSAAINGLTSEMMLHRQNKVGRMAARGQDKYSGG